MPPRLVLAAPALVLVIACGGSGSPDPGDGSSGPDATTTTTAETGDATTGGTSTAPGTSTSGEPDPAGTPTMLPTPTGKCPTLADGDVVFAPADVEQRSVRLWLSDAAATKDGPLVFYWHGTGSSPQEAEYGLGADYI